MSRAQAEPLFGQCLSIGSPLANQLQQLENKIEEGIEIGEKTLLCINRPIESADLHIEDFVGISFTHHMEILHKTTTLDERIYYIHQVNLYHWNKYVLRKYLSDDLYHHQGNMPNNFPKAIPDIKQSMKTISMFKDEYLLDFINTENLGLEIEDIDERVVEQEIVRNMRDFILQFGKDFIFMGNQYRVVLEGEEMFIDLLFFSRELAAMVAVELKYGKFKPSYLGQLCTYLQALDLTVKKPHENPSIGIVLCKEMNKAFVDIVVRNYDSPMGVATYKTKQDMPEELQKALPDLDKMKDLFCKSL
ncbi:PDDEXK nuclease domain-containing protein [Segatella copri]|nr:PDDEXK nuclease domain-containing protein [Segatella copri]MDV3106540.1 PDDEXK nuclease domain-containing protein [Segatella copri]WOF89397.1 PDDEXK nuclease domain-containing protein [Segatella copri]WOF95528.1 PDDEXK nuclease domain-containing protein [Segatella copri]